ncbi:phage head-tail connector protein [Neobacillus sp. PS3-40]|uniref:phage head-tail connector protein n=1 Tax=Neobacillus sp. PS3-40 TaxID=3070679 RepID=UPI0027DF27D8|nr:phage head-tail connector protein [Neobacillus sp. PS3-40]WML44085.1 phage head-tail connector protein [Neobacillus sp. PS3-40]
MDYLTNVKILLEIDELDIEKDGLLNLFIFRAIDYTLDYCKINEIPTSLSSAIEEMAVFQYRQRGIENVQSESKGSLSESYFNEYSPSIINRLRSNRRVVIL